jgi:leader peptidase (prepilin peptidase) / N-methyltransferase
MPLALQLPFALLIGLTLGSFGTMLLHRVPEGESILGRSHCPHCRHSLAWYDLLPLLSYFLLRGYCRSCHEPISLRYPLFEEFTALLAILLVLQFHLEPLHELLLIGAASFVLLLVAFYDYETKTIPDLFTGAIFLSALLLTVLRDPGLILPAILTSALGALVLFIFFGSLWLISQGKWIGSGDILLGIAIGFLLGWQHTLLALFLTYIFGGAIAAFLLFTGHAKRGTTIAFGPFLSAGTLITILYGEELITRYLNLL